MDDQITDDVPRHRRLLPALAPAALGDGSLALPRAAGRTAAASAGIAGLGIALASAVAIAAFAGGASPIVSPAAGIDADFAGAFAPLGGGLGGGGFALLAVAMLGGYLVALRHVRALPLRAVIAAILLAHLALLLAPPLLSTDVFSYASYGRMGALFGLNPYLHGPQAIAADPSFLLVGPRWIAAPTAYGPLFTLLSYALAPLGLVGSVFAFKALAAAASLACVSLAWICARDRGLDPARAALLIGLNPLLLLWGVGGGHNDAIVGAGLLAAILLAQRSREAAAGGALIAAVAVKLTAGLALPFLAGGLPAARRNKLLAAGLVGAAAVGLGALVIFGTGFANILHAIGSSQAQGDWHSIPGYLGGLFSIPATTPLARALLSAAVLAICGWLAVRTLRHRLDSVAAAGWAMLALLALSPALFPWYLAWLLPLVAVAADRRLERWAIAFSVAVLVLRVVEYVPLLRHLGLAG